MTAEMSASQVRPPTDAELATAAATGDRNAFGMIYDRYADRLYDYCAGMMRDRDAAADCVQDAFCTAAGALGGLRDPDKLRPWLYAIARSQVLHRIRDHRRETLVAEHFDSSSDDPGPDTMAARDELAALVAEAAGGLSERDQQVLDLTYRHGLDGAELAQVLGVTQTNANTLVHRLRDTVERSLGALLVSRGVRNTGSCEELAAILDGWDGHFNVLMRKRISRHIESCDVCDEERRRLVTPAALLGGAPVFIPAPEWLREATLRDVELVSHNSALRSDRSDRSSWLPASLFAAALVAVIGVSALWLTRDDPVLPADSTTTLPQSTVPPVAPVAPLPPIANTAPTSAPPPTSTVATTPVWTPAPTRTQVNPQPQPPAPQPEPPPPAEPEPEVPSVPPVVVDPPPAPDWLPGVLVPTPPPPRPNFQGPGALAPIPATPVPPPLLPVP